METPYKILILDDDADWLELCREIFAQLPSKPEIRTATSSSRALGMLDSEPFRLLICDLKMPRMDGLQVLSVVRRRFPATAHRRLERAGGRGISLARLRAGRGFVLAQIRHAAEFKNVHGLPRIAFGARHATAVFAASKARVSWTSSRWNVFPAARRCCASRAGRSWRSCGFRTANCSTPKSRARAARRRSAEFCRGNPARLKICRPNRTASAPSPNPSTPCSSNPRRPWTKTPIPSTETQFFAASHRNNVWKLSLLAREGAEFVIAVPPEGQGEPEAFGTQSSDPWPRGRGTRWRSPGGSAKKSRPARSRTSPPTAMEKQFARAVARQKILSRRLAAGRGRQPASRTNQKHCRLMGFLKKIARLFRSRAAIQQLPPGSLTVDRDGRDRHLHRFLDVSQGVARARSAATSWPCSAKPARRRCRSAEVNIHFGSLLVTARELRGGTIIFLQPQSALSQPPT